LRAIRCGHCSLLHLLCGTYEMASTDTVSNAGLVHITGAETCIVVASQAGNTNYVGSMAAPEKEHTISINQAATTTVTCGAVPFTYLARRSRLAGLASSGLAGSTTR
jgi:hypothetical protein